VFVINQFRPQRPGFQVLESELYEDFQQTATDSLTHKKEATARYSYACASIWFPLKLPSVYSSTRLSTPLLQGQKISAGSSS